MPNVGNAWHLPANPEPRGRGGMRDPVGAVVAGAALTIRSGNQFAGPGNAADQLQDGSAVFARRAADQDWTEFPLLFSAQVDNNKYFEATIPPGSWSPATPLSYLLRIAYGDRDTTYVHDGPGRHGGHRLRSRRPQRPVHRRGRRPGGRRALGAGDRPAQRRRARRPAAHRIRPDLRPAGARQPGHARHGDGPVPVEPADRSAAQPGVRRPQPVLHRPRPPRRRRPAGHGRPRPGRRARPRRRLPLRRRPGRLDAAAGDEQRPLVPDGDRAARRRRARHVRQLRAARPDPAEQPGAADLAGRGVDVDRRAAPGPGVRALPADARRAERVRGDDRPAGRDLVAEPGRDLDPGTRPRRRPPRLRAVGAVPAGPVALRRRRQRQRRRHPDRGLRDPAAVDGRWAPVLGRRPRRWGRPAGSTTRRCCPTARCWSPAAPGAAASTTWARARRCTRPSCGIRRSGPMGQWRPLAAERVDRCYHATTAAAARRPGVQRGRRRVPGQGRAGQRRTERPAGLARQRPAVLAAVPVRRAPTGDRRGAGGGRPSAPTSPCRCRRRSRWTG